ncbi:hypothetical protein jhhlp_002370 [Lomentospora prolificans]|uniref:Carboxypeptidase n=1 Tax=Lomentospora prolificans TaxID=41688 RepID=A0A2N3NDT7_9PEZI|nr:hypothetical protein jhhlp_002370 [Lomentospora prolificans]
MDGEVRFKFFFWYSFADDFENSYGGHYGPAFYRYFYEQNEAIKSGELSGLELELKTLGIGNGIIDAAIQFPFYADFAVNNTYGIQTLDEKWVDYMTTACYMTNGCLDQLWRCGQSYGEDTNSDTTRALCSQAASMCRDNVEGPYYSYSQRSMYDIRKASNQRPYPDFMVKYLNAPTTREALGVGVDFTYEDSSYDVYLAFQHSGDYAYPRFLQDLEFLLDRGTRILLVYGDADYIGNWFGGEAISLALNYTQSTFFRATPYKSLLSGEVESGKVREFGNLSFAVVHESGHLISVDKPGVALDLYNRAVWGRDLATGEKTLDEIMQIPLIPDLPSNIGHK